MIPVPWILSEIRLAVNLTKLLLVVRLTRHLSHERMSWSCPIPALFSQAAIIHARGVDMSLKISTVQSISLVILLVGLALCIRELQPWQTGAAQPVLAAESSSTQTLNFLPAIKNRYPWMNPFGVEPTVDLGQNSALFQRAVELHLGWVRLNDRISWRQLQPDEGGPILWGKLAQFENELRALLAAGLTPLVIIDDYPLWAVQISRKDGIFKFVERASPSCCKVAS